MSIKDEIKAIDERKDLTPDEKMIQKYFAKGDALLKKAEELIGIEFTEDNLEIVLTNINLDDKGQLLLWFTAKRDGKKITIPVGHFPFIIVNPPVGVRDSFGNVNEDPYTALKQVLVSLVKMY